MKTIACLCLALGAVGCSPDLLNNYDIYIADGFSQPEQNEILFVMKQWELAEKEFGLKFNVYYGTSSDPKGTWTIYPKTFAEIHTLPGSDPTVAAITNWDNYLHDSGSMDLPTDLPPNSGDAARRIMAHEFGHLLGLDHTGPHTIMYPYIDDGLEAHKITCADQDQYRANRGYHIFFCDTEPPLSLP